MSSTPLVIEAPGPELPALITSAGDHAAWRFLEFFTVNIRKREHSGSLRPCGRVVPALGEVRGISDIAAIKPVHVAGYIEQLQGERSAPTVKQHLACMRMLFDWLVTGQIVPTNPAHSVPGPRHRRRHGLYLRPRLGRGRAQGRGLLPAKKALVAAPARKERQGQRKALPSHLETYVDAYVEAAGIRNERKGPLFRPAMGRTGVLAAKAYPASMSGTWCAAAPPSPSSKPPSAATPSALPELPTTSATAASSKSRSAWPDIPTPKPPASTTGATTTSA